MVLEVVIGTFLYHQSRSAHNYIAQPYDQAVSLIKETAFLTLLLYSYLKQ